MSGALNGLRTGVQFSPTPADLPRFLVGARPDLVAPMQCRYDLEVPLTDAQGNIDALGNLAHSNCVQAAELNLIRLQRWQTGDRRRPTEAQAMALYERQSNYRPHLLGSDIGTDPFRAFTDFAQRGIAWGDQRLVVPRWTVLEEDGENVNLDHLKIAIHRLGGAIGIFRLPQAAFQTAFWMVPQAGSEAAKMHEYHAVTFGGYQPGWFYVATWGRWVAVHEFFVAIYLRQASAFGSDALLNAAGLTPAGDTQTAYRDVADDIKGV